MFSGDPFRGSLGMPWQLLIVLSQIVSGVALAGVSIIGWHALRRTLWRMEPGEYLLVVMGLTCLTQFVWRVIWGILAFHLTRFPF